MEENTETMTFTVELTDWGLPPPQKKKHHPILGYMYHGPCLA